MRTQRADPNTPPLVIWLVFVSIFGHLENRVFRAGGKLDFAIGDKSTALQKSFFSYNALKGKIYETPTFMDVAWGRAIRTIMRNKT